MMRRGPEVLAKEETDEEKALILMEYLTIIFRDKNKFLEIKRPNQEVYRVSEKLVAHAILWGAKQQQIRFEWTEDKTLSPRITIKGEEGSEFVQVSFGRALFKALWSDVERILPITLAGYMPDPEAFIKERVNGLKNGKIKFPVWVDKLETTKTLRGMMVEAYQLWQQFPSA